LGLFVLAPSVWVYNYSMCAGDSQSPIDINTTTVVSSTGSLSFSGYDSSPTSQNYTVTNTGHSGMMRTVICLSLVLVVSNVNDN